MLSCKHLFENIFRFPWVNFAITDSEDIAFFGKKDACWADYMQEAMKHNFKAAPGTSLKHGFNFHFDQTEMPLSGFGHS